MSIELLFEQIQSLLDGQNPRTLVGIVGKPGAGKSTVVEQIEKKYRPDQVSIIPMDGFHLSNEELISLGRRERKGAPDTFDVEGFISLIERVKIDHSIDHKFPIFHREIEASIADEGIVPKGSKVLVIEGNYLFSEEHSWSKVYPLLDHTWFIEIDDEISLATFVTEMEDRFGKMPIEVQDMIDLVRCRWKAQVLRVEKITLKNNILKLYFVSHEIPQEIVLKVIQFVNHKKGLCQLREKSGKMILQVDKISTIPELNTILVDILG